MTVLMMGTVALIAYKRGWGSDTGFEWKRLAERRWKSASSWASR